MIFFLLWGFRFIYCYISLVLTLPKGFFGYVCGVKGFIGVKILICFTINLISRYLIMAFAGILKDEDVAAAIAACAGKAHLHSFPIQNGTDILLESYIGDVHYN